MRTNTGSNICCVSIVMAISGEWFYRFIDHTGTTIHESDPHGTLAENFERMLIDLQVLTSSPTPNDEPDPPILPPSKLGPRNNHTQAPSRHRGSRKRR